MVPISVAQSLFKAFHRLQIVFFSGLHQNYYGYRVAHINHNCIMNLPAPPTQNLPREFKRVGKTGKFTHSLTYYQIKIQLGNMLESIIFKLNDN